MSLSFYEFTRLPDKQQFNLVFLEGYFIESRELVNSRYALYKLYYFFVEIEYNFSQNNIVGKIVFQKPT